MKRTFLSALVGAVALVLPTPSSAKTHQVNDLKTLAAIVGETAKAGDIIELLSHRLGSTS